MEITFNSIVSHLHKAAFQNDHSNEGIDFIKWEAYAHIVETMMRVNCIGKQIIQFFDRKGCYASKKKRIQILNNSKFLGVLRVTPGIVFQLWNENRNVILRDFVFLWDVKTTIKWREKVRSD